MKFFINFIFGPLLLLSLLTGCQMANTTNVALESSVKGDNGNKQETLLKAESVENETNVKEEVAAAFLDQTIIDLPSLKVGEEYNIDGLFIKLAGVREITVDHIKASKDRFIGVELQVVNNRKEEVKISSLPQLTFLANEQIQDMALITTKGDLSQPIQPGETLLSEVAFDSSSSNDYLLIFEDALTSELIKWSFTNDEIKKK